VRRFGSPLFESFTRSFPPEACVLNVGAGTSDYGPNVLNVDIAPGPTIHVVAMAEQLPFVDGSVDGCILQAVLEHVGDADATLSEIARVLAPRGQLLIELPFIQGFHASPADYRRFTEPGLRAEVERHGLHVDETGVGLGPASAMA